MTFNDVAGVEEAKQELEIIDSEDPKNLFPGWAYSQGCVARGLWYWKDATRRAMRAKLGSRSFYWCQDFVEMFVGVGASACFVGAGKKASALHHLHDEIDAVGRHRGAGLGGGHDEREQTLNQLLVEMDGFEANEGVILIAATNRPDVLDPALLHPGRFDRRVVVPRPDVRGREEILRVHSRRVPLDEAVDIATLARTTPGFSGADLENLVNEAALLAARKNKDKVDMQDFELSKDKVMMGAERRSMILSPEEKAIRPIMKPVMRLSRV